VNTGYHVKTYILIDFPRRLHVFTPIHSPRISSTHLSTAHGPKNAQPSSSPSAGPLSQHYLPSLKNQGLLSPYSTPGTVIGTGTWPLNTSISGGPSCWRLVPISPPRTGKTTPHSQFRQLSLSCFVTRSLERWPL
jgi:hypothetical protein